MRPIIRKRLKAATRRSERAAISQAVSPPPAPGSPLSRSAEQTQGSPPGGGCAAFPAAGGEDRTSPLSEALSQNAPAEGWGKVPTYFKSPDPGVPGIDGPPETGVLRRAVAAVGKTPSPAAPAPRREPITAEDEPLAVEGAEALQGLFAVNRQLRPPSLAEALAGGPPTSEQIDAAVERATRPRRQEILPLPPAAFDRLCPGCRSLDGEHDFGPTCTLDPELEETPSHLPTCRSDGADWWCEKGCPVRDALFDRPKEPHSWETVPAGAPPSDVEVVLGVPEVPAGSPGEGNLALPAAPLGPADVRSYFLAGRAPSTRAAYASDLQHFARWRGLEIDQALSDFLTGSAAQAHATALGWLQAMTEAKLAPATVARRLASLRSFVELAAQLGVVTWTLLLKAPKVEPFRDTRGPGREEVRKLMNHCGEGLEGVRNRALIVVFLGCGLRRNELALLRLRDYSRETGRIFVRGKGKGGEGKWLSLPAESSELLDRWLCESRQIACGEIGPLEREDDEPLFHSLERRERLSGEGIRYILNVVGKRAGVKIRPHGLRHAAITAVLEETGGNIRVAQSFSRHADPRTVLKYDDNRKDLGGEAAKIALRKILRGDEKEE